MLLAAGGGAAAGALIGTGVGIAQGLSTAAATTAIATGTGTLEAANAACGGDMCASEANDAGRIVNTTVPSIQQAYSTSTTAIQTYYPSNLGFSGQPQVVTLETGTVLDRYGSAVGKFLSPAGTPNWARALPPGTEQLPLNTYIVNKPIENVLSGAAAPWFSQIGGGIQYYIGTPYGQNVQSLLDSGYLSQLP